MHIYKAFSVLMREYIYPVPPTYNKIIIFIINGEKNLMRGSAHLYLQKALGAQVEAVRVCFDGLSNICRGG